MPSNMRDVASRAGVSVATVSRVMAGSSVSEPVRQRVAQAIEELAYVPNRLPVSLRATFRRTLALVIGNVCNPYFPELISGCETAAQAAGYSLIFSDTDEDRDLEYQVLARLAEERVAGILLAPAANSSEPLAPLEAVGIPIVVVDRRIDGAQLDTVTVDNFESTYEGVKYLLGLGHRRIGFIGGPALIASTEDRRRGFLAALEAANVAVNEALLVRGDLREQGGIEGCRQLLAHPEPPTAIVTANSLTTIGALKALRAAGVRVPADVSVVAFDDFLTAELLDPPLTAISQPVNDLGRRSVEILVDRLRDPKAPVRNEILGSTLIVRGSASYPREGPLGGPTTR